MFKTKHFIVLLFMCSGMFSVAQRDFLIPNRVGAKWGFKSTDGKTTIKAVYDSVCHFSTYFDSDIKGKYAKVQQGNLWGLINQKGEIMMPIQYKKLEHIRMRATADYYLAKDKNNAFGVIHRQKIRVGFEYDTLSYHYDHIAAQKDGKIGILDISGAVKIPIAYDQIFFIQKFNATTDLKKGWEFKNNTLIHTEYAIHVPFPKTRDTTQPFMLWNVSNTQETTYVITDAFSKLTDPEYKAEEGSQIIRLRSDSDTGEYTYEMLQKRYTSLKAKGYNFQNDYYFNDQFYKFSKDDEDLIGMYDVRANRVIIPPTFDKISSANRLHTANNSKHFFIVKADQKYGVYDEQGINIFPVMYDDYDIHGSIYLFRNPKESILFSVRTGKKSPKSYEFVKTVLYNSYTDDEFTLIKVKENGVVFYLDANMNVYYEK